MLALIVAYARNRVIGNKGKIPWHIEGEQARFRELTTGNVIIMGRRTYEEIGFPLPNRITIVVSTTKKYEAENCYTVSSFEEALKLADTFGKNVYVSGGAGLYGAAIELVEKLYVTEIDLEVEGDTYFPEFDETKFEKKVAKRVDGEIPYVYVTYTRI